MKLSLSVRIAESSCKTKLNVPFRDLVQLAVDQRDQPVEGGIVALAPLEQQFGDHDSCGAGCDKLEAEL